jgi:hypothetical protein
MITHTPSSIIMCCVVIGALDLADSLKIAVATILYILGYLFGALMTTWSIPHYISSVSYVSVDLHCHIIVGGNGMNRYGGCWYGLAWLIVSPWLHAWTLRHLSECINCCNKLYTRLLLFSRRNHIIAIKQRRAVLQVCTGVVIISNSLIPLFIHVMPHEIICIGNGPCNGGSICRS